jgi:hypothetical protein
VQDEDTLRQLRDQVRRAQDHYESLVRLEEQHPRRDWIATAIDKAEVALYEAKQALQAALETPAPPIVSESLPPPPRPATTEPVDPSTRTRAKQARFHDCAQFRAELEDALVQLRDDPEGVFTRVTIARALGCSVDTLDNYRAMCQVDLRAEIARAQRSKRSSDTSENFG